MNMSKGKVKDLKVPLDRINVFFFGLKKIKLYRYKRNGNFHLGTARSIRFFRNLSYFK